MAVLMAQEEQTVDILLMRLLIMSIRTIWLIPKNLIRTGMMINTSWNKSKDIMNFRFVLGRKERIFLMNAVQIPPKKLKRLENGKINVLNSLKKAISNSRKNMVLITFLKRLIQERKYLTIARYQTKKAVNYIMMTNGYHSILNLKRKINQKLK